jgi:SAM-dependent methyltransferase
MCTVGCIMFGVKNLKSTEVRGRNIVEIGACEVNGSLRPILESYAPASYVGVDIAEGVGVDIICDAERVLERLEKERFDIVISTEVIEHTRDWKRVISNIKNLCAPEGTILITTRSLGFHYHAYPYDFWRYETEDMKEIFSDCEIVSLEKDPGDPGVFLKVRKPAGFKENDLGGYQLYSMVAGRRIAEVTDGDFQSVHFRRLMWKRKRRELKKRIKQAIRNAF